MTGFVIRNGVAPSITFFSERVGRDAGAAGHGWTRDRSKATVFASLQAASHFLERDLWRDAPNCTIEGNTPAARDAEHWQALGLTPGASAKQIRLAYRRLAQKWHPDRAGGDAERFKKIQCAYDALSSQ